MNNEIEKKYVDLFIDNEYKSVELYSLDQFESFSRSVRKYSYIFDGIYKSKGGSSYLVYKRLSSYFCVLVRR